MLGLTLAYRFSQAGHDVTLFEAAPHLGGLASAWTVGGVTWDRHYHVTLLSDTSIRSLLAELGLESEMEWVTTRTGVYSNGALYSVSNGIEFLKFPALGVADKLRLGGTIFYGSKVQGWRRLEQIAVEDWLTKLSGRQTFDQFWRPLLEAKLGNTYRISNAAFIWATIQRLYAARRTGLKKEMFGYLPGGYARILQRFGSVLHSQGVNIRLGAAVAAVERQGQAVVVHESDGTTHRFDDVVVTSNASIASRIIKGLEPDARSKLEAINYQGIVCASLLLKRSLSPFYLTYIIDRAPFTAVVEMSALVDRRHFDGHSLIYLPKYCGPNDATARMSDVEVEEQFLGGLEQMYPAFSRDQVLGFRISRVREVFAVPTLGYSRRVPPMETSVSGVHIVTSAQIINGTLNVNETVQLAERAAARLLNVSPVPPVPITEKAKPAAPCSAHVRTPSVAHEPSRVERAAATLSIDLDNLWSYLKTKGDAAWRSFPTFLGTVVPTLSNLLDQRGQVATWFIVGQDAAMPEHRNIIRSVAAAGHEVGNHSYLHEPWMHRYPAPLIDQEIALAEDAIADVTGMRPFGFRGPGYSLSEEVLAALSSRGYQYDASTLPTFVGPLARAFYLRGTRLTVEEREQRRALFGTLMEGRRPIQPYAFSVDGVKLIEVPVTTMPGLRTPIHMSYLIYLAEIREGLAQGYLDLALRICRRMNIAPSFLLHSHDVVGPEDAPAMRFFPGFRRSGEEKRRLVAWCIDRLQRDFEVMTIRDFVSGLSGLPAVTPRFTHTGSRLAPTDISDISGGA